MNSKNIDDKIKKLNEALKFKSREEKLHFDAVKIHLNIMHQVQLFLDNKKMSHSDLSELLNVSEAYISKLFSGDKLLNLEKIAQLQDIFSANFNFSFGNKNSSFTHLKKNALTAKVVPVPKKKLKTGSLSPVSSGLNIAAKSR